MEMDQMLLVSSLQHHSGQLVKLVFSEGTFVGTGVTIVDFKSSNGLNNVQISSGIATVTVTTGASIGLVIALGG
jgi:hypothetical protein